MNAKEATKQIRLEQCEEIIHDCYNSGLKADIIANSMELMTNIYD